MEEELLKKIESSTKNTFVGVAGPGTGKSTFFKTIIDSEEFKGKKILVLSFINKLIDDLTEDLKGYKNVTVSTLHSFAKKQLGKGVELDSGLDELISEDYLLIERKEINFEAKFHENEILEIEEKFYKERKEFYSSRGKRLYSLSSIVYAANKIFEEYEDKIPSKYDLILIDEFQDFNKLESIFINFLNTKNKVLLVGDDNQSLYGFKKAKPDLIRELYEADHTQKFSLDYCYRCTEVIVNASNSLLENARSRGFLKKELPKKFLYPSRKEKDDIGTKFPLIDFFPKTTGDLLCYKIKEDIEKSRGENKDKKRILILLPKFLQHFMYGKFLNKGFNVVEFELFSNEELNKIKHIDMIDTFNRLLESKTDSLS
ncbi:MAG: UvrD-helicase domain-containing protein, partial [Candidatus Nanoarchaeia archaeon]|nr:UvrD-helicase domain-containing protein [Candidatus Nanoarchaeia archaeon]